MRTNIVHEGAHNLVYEIRHIVAEARKIAACGVEITWENIGDPVAMGERVAPWIVEKVHALLDDNLSWGYCLTRGVCETREFLAHEVNLRGGVTITPEDILFFNGVADAVDKVYDLVHRNARILMPTPTYTTHSSNESKRGGYESIFYHLDPQNNWLPDVEEIRLKAKYNPAIAAIALVNPDNPTGMTYPRAVLEEIVEIARTYKLFLICDEIYAHISYNGYETTHLSTLVGEVPAIIMRGISKEFPWPGARCGWLEILNIKANEMFRTYTDSLHDAKMMEVCSTTLPQMAIPKVCGDARYPAHLRSRAKKYELRAKEAYDTFADLEGVTVNLPQGALYFCVLFKPDTLNDAQSLPITNPQVRELVEGMTREVAPDKRFVYYLLGAEGICVVPMTGFASKLQGFRITLLQEDDEKRRATLACLRRAVKDYLASA